MSHRHHEHSSTEQERIKSNARRIYNYICAFSETHGYAPTITQMAQSCYMSRATVVRYLNWLEAWNYIWREPGTPRAITIIDPKRRL
jgi:repressor LexA